MSTAPPTPAYRPFWWRPYLEWLSQHPLLILEVLLLLLIVWGWIGEDYGLPNLFWHEHWGTQLVAGLGVSLLLGVLGFVGYLLDAEADWMKPPKPANGGASPYRRLEGWEAFRWYHRVTRWPLLVVFAARAFVPASGEGSFAVSFNNLAAWPILGRLPFVVGLFLGIPAMPVLAVLLGFVGRIFTPAVFDLLPQIRQLFAAHPGPRQLTFEQYRQARQHPSAPAASAVVPPPPLPTTLSEHLEQLVFGSLRRHVPVEYELHVLAGRFFVLLLLAYLMLATTPLGEWVSPALVLCLLLAILAGVYGFLRYNFPRTVLPALAGIVLAALLCNMGPDKHRFSGLEDYYADPVPLAKYDERRQQPSGLLDDRVALESWHKQQGKEKPRLVLVAVSGGGIRSAVWSAVVLNRLEHDIPGFSSRVRLITGASGGMLGAAQYTTTLDALRKVSDADGRTRLRRLHVASLSVDALSDLARTAVLRDLPRTFWPAPYYQDRGWALEQAWSKNLEGTLDIPFRSLRAGEEEGWRPSLIFAPMLVEDGRRVLISNLDLDALTWSTGGIAAQEGGGKASLSGMEFFRLFPDAKELKLSTAVRMNASFPFVTPASTLPTEPPRRVVDAGYYDNFGINLAAVWLEHHRNWIRKHTSGVVLVQVHDQVRQRNLTNLVLQEEAEPGSFPQRLWRRLGRGLQEVTTPLEGALEAMQAAMAFRNDEQLQAVGRLLNRDKGDDFFATVVIECPEKAALSWYLTRAETRHLISGLDDPVPDTEASAPTSARPADEVRLRNREAVQRLKTLLQ